MNARLIKFMLEMQNEDFNESKLSSKREIYFEKTANHDFFAQLCKATVPIEKK